MKKILLILLVLIGVTVVVSCSDDENKKDPSETIKIGLLLPFGGTTPSGPLHGNAVRMAMKKIGKINEKEVEFVEADSANGGLPCMVDGAEVKSSICGAKILRDAKVVAVIGALWSSRTIKAAEAVLIPAGIPIVSPTSTSTELTKMDDKNLVWRVCPSDLYQGKAAAEYIKNNWKDVKNVAILQVDDPNVPGDYGDTLAEEFQKAFVVGDLKVVITEKYPEGIEEGTKPQEEYQKHLNNIKAKNPDLIYMITYEVDGAGFIDGLQSWSKKPKLFGCDGNGLPGFVKSITDKTLAEGMVGTMTGADPSSEKYKTFVSEYKSEYKEEPRWNIEYSYDAMFLLAKAMTLAQSEDPAVFVPKMREASDSFDGVSGAIKWDENGDITTGSYFYWKVEKGELLTEGTGWTFKE